MRSPPAQATNRNISTHINYIFIERNDVDICMLIAIAYYFVKNSWGGGAGTANTHMHSNHFYFVKPFWCQTYKRSKHQYYCTREQFPLFCNESYRFNIACFRFVIDSIQTHSELFLIFFLLLCFVPYTLVYLAAAEAQ